MNKLRLLLLPFSILFGAIAALRNLCYDLGVLKSFSSPIPTIVIGNLSTGGTGKTPHVEVLFNLLRNNYKVAILSRGYGRKTKGFILVNSTHSSQDVGDEPRQYKQKFGNNSIVSVCEKRVDGVKQLLRINPELDVILLDDAFQHRALKGGYQILLSEFNKPFFRDFPLPAGNLREFAFGRKRADMCVFTKCPQTISSGIKSKYARKFSNTKPVFFSKIAYSNFIALNPTHQFQDIKRLILVTGIANPKPLISYCESSFEVINMPFNDHHDFSVADILKIHEIFGNFTDGKCAIVTTEKDAMRLSSGELKLLTNDFPWFMLPISIEIEANEQFEKEIIHYVESNKRSSSLHSK